MEFGIHETKSSLKVDWNGPTEELCRKMIMTSISKKHHLKIFLHYPKMPTNHVLCLFNRIRRSWFENVGRSTNGANKALEALETFLPGDQMTTDDQILIKLLEKINLDDVAEDIDLMAVKKWTEGPRTTSIWAFCFAPDDLDHFLKNVKINNDILCYGRNGDPDLK